MHSHHKWTKYLSATPLFLEPTPLVVGRFQNDTVIGVCIRRDLEDKKVVDLQTQECSVPKGRNVQRHFHESQMMPASLMEQSR